MAGHEFLWRVKGISKDDAGAETPFTEYVREGDLADGVRTTQNQLEDDAAPGPLPDITFTSIERIGGRVIQRG